LGHKKFSDFAKESAILDGNKLSMSEIINREILIIGYRLSDSKYSKNNNNKCLTLHIELDNKRYIVFTGSVILIEQIEKYKDEIPFLATIKQIDKYYTFS
jgi:hypothetical protein